MYTITILRSSPQSQTSFKDMLDPKRSKFGPKRAQNGQELNFFRTVNLNFCKGEHKNSYYTKNQQNSMNHLEDISHNVDFGPERSKFGQKRAQNLNFLKEYHKISFYTKN